MSRENTRHGAYDISLENEIHRILEQLIQIGIKNPTKLEATALIAEKNKRARISIAEVRDFISKQRGLK